MSPRFVATINFFEKGEVVMENFIFSNLFFFQVPAGDYRPPTRRENRDLPDWDSRCPPPGFPKNFMCIPPEVSTIFHGIFSIDFIIRFIFYFFPAERDRFNEQ